MKNVIIFGSSGMIGGLVLRECLERTDVGLVTSVVRRPSGITHPKLKELVHADMLDLSAIQEQFERQDICFFCIGVYTGAVPKQEFRKITVDQARSVAGAMQRNNAHVVFCFLSGDGADRTEKSRMMFARDKGAAENILVAMNFDRLHVFRPGYIYPVTPRKEPNVSYAVMRALYVPVLARFFPNIGLRSTELAHAMVQVAFMGGPEILENRDIIEAAK